MSEAIKYCNPEEALFVYQYLQDRDKKAAAMRCGKPEKWARSWGNRVFNRPHVRQAIDEAIGLMCHELGINATWVLRELIELYNMDLDEIVKYHKGSGEPYFDFTDISPELMSSIEQIEISPNKYGTKIKVKLPEKLKLLETIGKHIDVNAFKELVEVSGAVQVVNFDDQDEDA